MQHFVATYFNIVGICSDFLRKSEAPEPRGQLCPFLIAIKLFYHPNNFASDVRNVINESELIVVGRHWSF